MSKNKRRKRNAPNKGKRIPTLLPNDTRKAPLPYSVQLYQQTKLRLQSFAQYLYQLRIQEHRLAKFLHQYLQTVISNTFLLILFTLIGLNSPASSIPLIPIIYQHRTLSVLIIVILLFYLLRVLLVGNTSEPKEGSNKINLGKKRLLRPLVLVNTVSYTGSILFLVMLVLILVRPVWCPMILCPLPERILITHSQSVHDDKLEMYFAALQSTSYVIPNDPAKYTPANLPENIGALHTDGENSTFLYHLIFGLQSLQQGRFGMVIEEVDIVIYQVFPMAHPLNVWSNTSLIDYENNNHYRAVYFGQQAGAVLRTNYLRFKNGFVHLKPGETDQIDVHIISRIEADIKFSMQIIYRVDNESQRHTLRLPLLFEVMFANPSDWRLYHLQDGHLVANS